MIPAQGPLSARLMAIVTVGTILECYDFAVYGYFANLIAALFFPSVDRFTGLMATFAVFAAGFTTRILGGFLYGIITDRTGGLRALRLSVGVMVAATTLIGLLPGYKTIGFWAPLCLALLRMVQGLSFGGQFSTAMTFLVEQALPHKRGVVTGWLNAAALGGFLLGSGVGALLSYAFTPATLNDWGWRIPFLLGLIPGIASLFATRILSTLAAPRRSADSPSVPALLRTILPSQWRNLLLTLGCSALFILGFWIPYVYLPSGVQFFQILPMNQALLINTGCLLLTCMLGPLAGSLSDRLGPRRVLLVSGALAAVLSPLLFKFIEGGGFWRVTMAQVIVALLLAAPGSVAFLPVVERFPKEVRATTFSISYNVASLLFGSGALPFVTYVVQRTGSLSSAGWILSVSATLSLVAWWLCPDPAATQELTEETGGCLDTRSA